MDYTTTIGLLANRWASAGPLLPGFTLLARGGPVSVEEIADAAGTEVGQNEEAVIAARCKRDESGRLIDLYGLTLAPTSRRQRGLVPQGRSLRHAGERGAADPR